MSNYKPRRSTFNKNTGRPHSSPRNFPHHSNTYAEHSRVNAGYFHPFQENFTSSRGRGTGTGTGRGRGRDRGTGRGRRSPILGHTQSQSQNEERGNPRPIPYKSLDEMVKDESITPSDLAVRLSTEASGFYVTLKQELREGMIQVILKVSAKICKDDNPNQSTNYVLKTLLESNFHEKASSFLHGIASGENPQHRNVAATHVSNCLHLVKAWMTKMPVTSKKQVSMLQLIIQDAVSSLGIETHEQIVEVYSEVKEIWKELQTPKVKNVKEEKKDQENTALTAMHQESPPDDFRQIPVFPRQSDINTTSNPFVRTNLVSNAYQSQDHYLDVQYRLLREDFVRPLREGIREYLTAETPMFKKHARVQNIKVYNKVKIEYPFPGPRGMLYCIHFDPNPLRGVRWQSSKRLLYGNLICLSSDKFKNNLLFATVAQRDPEKLSFGYLNVEFVHSTSVIEIESAQVRNDHSSDDDDMFDDDLLLHEEEMNPIFEERFTVPDVDMQQEYTMVETEAYFEAYRHVLAGLQEITTIPLERYLLRCQSEVQPPQYLRNNPQKSNFTFSSVFKSSLPPTKGVVNVLNENSWPTAEELSLDDSQKEALINALTREMSIIQGPPGTGKTYIGLIIMKLMLANNFTNQQQPRLHRALQPSTKKNPILVVCYTNHALDQFLEGIAEFHPTGIVRVGGRCKNKNLENYTLMKVKRNSNYSTKFNRRTIWDLRNEMKRLSDIMMKSIETLEVSTTVLLNLETIQHVIPVNLYNQIDCSYHKKPNEAFLEWLGVASVEKSKLDKEFVSFQVLKTIVSYFNQNFPMQFHPQHIYDAIVTNQSLNFQMLLTWMLHFPFVPQRLPSTPPTELILDILQTLPMPSKCSSLQKLGYSKAEINCAIIVTGNRNPKQWLESNSQVNEFDAQLQELNINEAEAFSNDEDNEFEVEEEAALLQEQRMLEDDLYIKLSNVNTKEADKESRRKTLINKISAATFESIEGNNDPDDDGFVMQSYSKKKRRQRLKKEIGKTDAMSKESAAHLTDIHQLPPEKRWSLYRRWVSDFRARLRQDVDKHILNYNRTAKTLLEMQRSEDRAVLEQADVVGITTTGAAKYRDIIHKLPVQIVIVEEAAEVLEAHIVTSMPESTEHLILIGDHQQLKPSPTVYELAVKYNLDVSLFERMIRNDAPFTRLRIQHRMRPRIADLLRIDIYNDLIDHCSVKRYEEVMGVQKSVFFITHEQLEQSVADGRSKINQHEADYMVALCQYLMCQGYEPRQITILAAYTGQLFAFKRIMKNKLHQGVRVTAVDNFQGEENDIILLSLVRSNKENSIGFLKVQNRVCVALSRAKIGLYCIGNFTILQEKSRYWQNIVKNLKLHGQFGESLPLQCKNHPDYVTQAAVAMDFTKVPEGGCGKPCEFRLPCGHRCTRSCHPDDEDHTKYKCRKSCPKKCPQGHNCPLKCYENCGNCRVAVKKTIPSCYHLQDVPCYQDPGTFDCKMPCTKILGCSHKCAGKCGGPCTTKCMVQVSVNSPCGHAIKVPCHTSAKPEKAMCKEKCNVMLKCEHYCKGSCYKCSQGRLHQRCQQKCNRPLVCGHTCRETCAQNCPPCTEKCTTMCEHSKCKKKCSEPCVPCTEKCQWKCDHYSCTKLCCEPCDRPPCNLPCPKKIKKCGHPCIGLCGEPCPKLCRICDKDKVTEIFFGDEDEDDARFVELEDCKHIFTYEGLDTWMNQNSNDEDENVEIALKECPQCKTPIRKSRRYGKIVNKQLEMINVIKMKIAGNQREVNAEREKVLRDLLRDKHIKQFYKNESDILSDELHEKNIKTMTDVHVAEVKYSGLSRLAEMQNNLNDKSRAATYRASLELWKEFEECCQKLCSWLTKRRVNFSAQEVDDLDRELMRLKQCVVLLKLKPSASPFSRGYDEVEKLENLLFHDFSPYSQAKQEKVERCIKDIKQKNPLIFSGLGITDDERKMIVSAMNLSKGHWYKCKNGHVYAIGECGGATERGECPECKETIGGVSHRLDEGNQLAGEMDGATTSAFDPNNMYIPPELL